MLDNISWDLRINKHRRIMLIKFYYHFGVKFEIRIVFGPSVDHFWAGRQVHKVKQRS